MGGVGRRLGVLEGLEWGRGSTLVWRMKLQLV
jgi:hypothetical protein